MNDVYVVDKYIYAWFLDFRAALSQRHHKPTPVRVSAVDHGLDQAGGRDLACRRAGVSDRRGTLDGNREDALGALAIPNQFLGQVDRQAFEGVLEEPPRR